MSFRINLDIFDAAYAEFLSAVRDSIQRTFAEEVDNGVTQKNMADVLHVDQALISRRLNGPGNITLKTLCDLFTAMGREPLSNFEVPPKVIIKNVQPKSATSGAIGALDLAPNPVSSPLVLSVGY